VGNARGEEVGWRGFSRICELGGGEGEAGEAGEAGEGESLWR
jgi:hypothetical protein